MGNHTRGNQSSSNERIQSSVVTNLGGINIGNTITIINIGTGWPQAGESEPAGKTPIMNTPTLNDTGRSAITSAAARAFCDSVGCTPSQEAQTNETLTGSSPFPVTPSVTAVHAARSYEVGHHVPSNHSSKVAMGSVQWLLLVAVLVELRHR
ncbi:unnamed protein product [Hyaloperonospora brassicae]|uniref:Uncharacterized protein n=1 Tax=Hyaloperonospora brassicae TaxID=162125 RepID=A0AAV0UA06_HYABA|nr:unnamed protein product [Hyaloperonospora brassicae]